MNSNCGLIQNASGLQIVTIHKSKDYGMRWCYRRSFVPIGKTRCRVITPTKVPPAASISGQKTSREQAAEEQLAGDLRSLYVALTRGITLSLAGAGRSESQ